jgi:hypothetical protein
LKNSRNIHLGLYKFVRPVALKSPNDISVFLNSLKRVRKHRNQQIYQQHVCQYHINDGGNIAEHNATALWAICLIGAVVMFDLSIQVVYYSYASEYGPVSVVDQVTGQVNVKL